MTTSPLAGLDLSARTLRRNIWSGLLCATDQEIRDGMDFYPGAHGLCRLFAGIHPSVTVEQVVGIYAALSPMNGWESNVANVLDILRDGEGASVNTFEPNRVKAMRILHGEHPLSVLGGRKVRAFYGGMASPDNTNLPPPVDRHLVCLALGSKLSKNDLSRAIGSSKVYTAIERAYLDLGAREGLGNRLASIAWFVQRRIATGQHPLPHPDSPVCCGAAMWSYGRTPRRFHCPRCSRMHVPAYTRPRYVPRLSEVLYDIPLPLDRISVDRRNRPRIHLGKGKPFMSSAGWQYLARYVVMWATGEPLRRDEEVHHVNGNRLDCRRDNLKVMLAEHHGRHHARYQLLYMLRDRVTGRWLPSEVPPYADQRNEIGEWDMPWTTTEAHLDEVPF